MPTSRLPTAGSSRRTPQQHQQQRQQHQQPQQAQNSAFSLQHILNSRTPSERPSTRPHLSSTARHRHATSSSTGGPVHTTLHPPPTIDLTSGSFALQPHTPTSDEVLPRPSDIVAELLENWEHEDWTAALLNGWAWGVDAPGLSDYFSTDEDYDEDGEGEDEGESEDDIEDDDEDEDEDLEDDEEEDSFDQDDIDAELFTGDYLGLEEESLFVENDFYLGGEELDEALFPPNPADFSYTEPDFLDAVAADDFSSPSSYPSFIHGPSLQLALDQAARRSLAGGNRPAPPTVHSTLLSPPSRTTTNQTATSQTTNPRTISLAISDDEAESEAEEEDNTPHTSFSEEMPPTTRRSSQQRMEPPPKRRRTSTTHRATGTAGNKHDPVKLDDDDIFEDTPARRQAEATEVGSPPALDLTKATEVPEELRAPVQDNRTKLKTFQCVICMDDVTALTVTHCGHLYCAGCLHSSIHTGSTKGRCPMCRQKLEVKPRANYTSKTKGHWLLELKLAKSTRKGKRKAGA